MKKLNNLLIIAGTGRKSGKTTLACSLIERFADIRPIALKISPHFHEPSVGLEILNKTENFNIYRELSEEGDKDSSKMLISGASSAYYIQVFDDNAGKAFNWLIKYLDTSEPIICESPALRRYVEPGVFIIADSNNITNKKDLGDIYDSADRIVLLGSKYDLSSMNYSEKGWIV